MNEDLLKRLAQAKIVLLDVDGVLTDGGLYYSNSGERTKKFYVKDGTGIRLLMKNNIEVVFITGLQSDLVDHRARDLQVTEVIQDCFDKDEAAEELIKRKSLKWEEVAFMGDDLIDRPLMLKVGLAVAVSDAIDEIKQVAHYVTTLPGGRGAVRELCDLILSAKEIDVVRYER